MSSDIRKIRQFVCRKLDAARRTLKRRPASIDLYRKGFIDALSMVQSFIDKGMKEEAETHE